MRTVLLAAICIPALTAGLSAGPTAPTSAATIKITQSHLVGLCLNGQALKGDRNWNSEESLQTLAFTMRNEPRTGIASAAPGVAVVSFTPEAGHRYEVEVRSEPDTFSTRVWAQGQWTPVVRDRTTDRIVSGEPVWQAASCELPY